VTVSFRPMQPSDRDFVISAWSSSYRTSHYAGLLSMRTYADVMHREIKLIIDHPSTLTIVAEEPGEVDEEGRPFLYGFIARRAAAQRTEPPYLYYVYVKTPYRRGRTKGLEIGYAAQLFRAAGIDPRRPFEYACETSVSLQLARKIPLGEFNSLPARFLETP